MRTLPKEQKMCVFDEGPVKDLAEEVGQTIQRLNAKITEAVACGYDVTITLEELDTTAVGSRNTIQQFVRYTISKVVTTG
jgi:hypothetical protein